MTPYDRAPFVPDGLFKPTGLTSPRSRRSSPPVLRASLLDALVRVALDRLGRRGVVRGRFLPSFRRRWAALGSLAIAIDFGFFGAPGRVQIITIDDTSRRRAGFVAGDDDRNK
jgi:hypothetical protein